MIWRVLTYPVRLLRHWAEEPEGRAAHITYDLHRVSERKTA